MLNDVSFVTVFCLFMCIWIYEHVRPGHHWPLCGQVTKVCIIPKRCFAVLLWVTDNMQVFGLIHSVQAAIPSAPNEISTAINLMMLVILVCVMEVSWLTHPILYLRYTWWLLAFLKILCPPLKQSLPPAQQHLSLISPKCTLYHWI